MASAISCTSRVNSFPRAFFQILNASASPPSSISTAVRMPQIRSRDRTAFTMTRSKLVRDFSTNHFTADFWMSDTNGSGALPSNRSCSAWRRYCCGRSWS